MSMASDIKKKFPFVFEREVNLAEVDNVVRYLMSTGSFATIDVVEKNLGTSDEQLVLVAQLLRKINKINITGNRALSDDDIKAILKINEEETFERKELLATADDLQTSYAKEGFFNPKIDIDFQTPNDNVVDINVKILEGKPCEVTEVNVDTSNKKLLQRARRRSAKLLNNRLSEEKLEAFRKDMESYFASNRYLATRLSTPSIVFNPDKSKAKITFAIENPNRYEFLFDGNYFFSAGQLISSLDLDRLHGITTSPAADLAERIQKLYLSKGFAHAIVDYNEKYFEEEYLQRIRFKITEGPRVRIRKIEITGNISRPPDYYAKSIRNTSSDLVDYGYYNRRDIEEGYKNLVIQLQNEGFLRAKVQSVRSEFNKRKDEATVSIAIDEGPLTQIRQLRFVGATAFSKAQLEKVMLVRAGEPLSLTLLEDSLLRLKNFYHSDGYLEMKIENEGEDLVTYNDTNTHANIEIKIAEGPKVQVASILPQGNTITRDEVILRELDFSIGDILTPEKIEYSVYKLQKLNLFSQVEIKTLEEGTTKANRTVIVKVQDRMPGLFQPGVGITNRYQVTYRGYMNFAYRNIGGTGRAVNLRLDLDYAADPRFSFLENRIAAGYLEPYIMGKNQGRVNIFREQKVEPPTEDPNARTVINENLGVDFLLERDLNRNIRLTYLTWGFENKRDFFRDNHETTSTVNIGRTGPILELDYRDDPFDTTAGTYTRLGVEYADPLLLSSHDQNLTVQFVRATAAWTRFTRLFDSRRFLLINSVRGGYLSNVSNAANSGVPNDETFSLGGTSTIRGFDVQKDTDRIPNIFQLNVDPKVGLRSFRMIGDSEYYLLKSELRIPLFGPVALALFYDGGGVVLTQNNVRIDDPYRDSWGFGFRVNTPAGPVSADMGFKLDRRSYYSNYDSTWHKEEPFAIHFSIGNF